MIKGKIKKYIEEMKGKSQDGFLFLPVLLIGAVATYFVAPTIAEGAQNIVTWFFQMIMTIASLIMVTAGGLLDLVMKFSLSVNIGDLEAVKAGWTITRDVANMFFIFILLYIAIATILRLSSYGAKDLLVQVIIIALLINFSMVFTKFIIDGSNMLALEFYSAMDTEEATISENLMSGLEIQKVYELHPQEKLSISNTLVVSIFSTVLFGLTAYVLFLGAFIFLGRMITFIFLLILAPLAFISMILPSTKGHSEKWWTALFAEALVAPAYLFLIYVVVKIINSGALLKEISGAITGNTLDVSLLLNFFIIGGLMYGSVKVAKGVGGQGSTMLMGFGEKAANWMTRGFTGDPTGKVMKGLKWAKGEARGGIARIDDKLGEGERLKERAAKHPRIGGVALRAFDRAKATGGHEGRVETAAKTGSALSPELRAQYMANASQAVKEKMFKDMSARDRVDLYDKYKGNKSVLEELEKKLSLEDREKMTKTRAEVELKKSTTEQVKTFKEATSNLQAEMLSQMKDKQKIDFVSKIGTDADAKKVANPDYANATDQEIKVANGILKANPTLAEARSARGTEPKKTKQEVIIDIVSKIAPDKARFLPTEARTDKDVIAALSKAQLKDLLKDGSLTQKELDEIKKFATAEALAYLQSTAGGKLIQDTLGLKP